MIFDPPETGDNSDGREDQTEKGVPSEKVLRAPVKCTIGKSNVSTKVTSNAYVKKCVSVVHS